VAKVEHQKITAKLQYSQLVGMMLETEKDKKNNSTTVFTQSENTYPVTSAIKVVDRFT